MYLAFGQNLLVSVMFFADQGAQPHPINKTMLCSGLLRWLGSFVASMAFTGRVETTPLLLLLFSSIFVWDAAYVALIWSGLRKEKEQEKD